MYKALIGNIRRAKDLGREEALKEVFGWLDKITLDDADGCGHPMVSFIGFDDKAQMLQSFKDRFNIE